MWFIYLSVGGIKCNGGVMQDFLNPTIIVVI